MSERRRKRHSPDQIIAKLPEADAILAGGTLMRSLASHKSLKPMAEHAPARKRNDDDNDSPSGGAGGRDVLSDWLGKKRSNATHRSTTEPDAMLARKGRGKEAQLCHSGHVLMDNRNGLCVDVSIGHATGTAEREAALKTLRRARRRHRLRPRTVAFETGYDDGKFLDELERKHKIIPYVPIRRGRIKATDAAGRARRRARRRSRTKGYAISQRIRKRVEQIIGWGKTVGRLGRYRG